MVATIGGLLELLDQQTSAIRPPELPISATDELALAWAGLARSASRALGTLTGPGRQPAASGTLAPVAALSDGQLLARPLGAHGWLAPPATTIGFLADLLTTAPIGTRPVDAAAATAVAAPILTTLHRAADRTLEFLSSHGQPQPLTGRIQTLAATTQPSGRDAPTWSYLHEWRLSAPGEAGLSGAVHDWASTALSHLATHQAVTKLSLQILSGDVAVICNAAAAVIRSAAQAGVLPVDEARATHRALQTATTTWQEAIAWPDHLQLSGRTPQIRTASAALRAAVDEHLRDGNDWKPVAALFSDWTPADALADTRHDKGPNWHAGDPSGASVAARGAAWCSARIRDAASRSAVSFGSARPTPIASTLRPQNGWSPRNGWISCVTPAVSAAARVPIPPWWTAAATWASSSSCGAVGTTSSSSLPATARAPAPVATIPRRPVPRSAVATTSPSRCGSRDRMLPKPT